MSLNLQHSDKFVKLIGRKLELDERLRDYTNVFVPRQIYTNEVLSSQSTPRGKWFNKITFRRIFHENKGGSKKFLQRFSRELIHQTESTK